MQVKNSKECKCNIEHNFLDDGKLFKVVFAVS